MPKRIQRQRRKGWQMPENAVYIGRPSEWGNPFKAGDTLGDVSYRLTKEAGLNDLPPETTLNPAMAVKLFEAWAKRKLKLNPHWLDELHGKDLACWCPEGAACHGDVLIELANR